MTSRRLSIALLSSARSWRGSSVSFATIAQALLDCGHRVQVLVGDTGMVDAFARLGLPVSRVLTENTGVREARALAGALRATAADAVLVDRPRDLRLAALASLLYPLSIVNCYNLSRARPPGDLLSRLAYRRVSLTVFVSETSASSTLHAAPYIRRRPHRVIHGAVDMGRFGPDAGAADAFRAAYGLAGTRFVLAVGALTPEKRYDFLLEVWARLGADALPLVVCGQGSQRAGLQARALELGLDVRFLGHLGPDELPGAYAAAACMVHPGAVETFGLSVLEGMASGLAVVGVQGGALPEVVADAGVLVPVDDVESFTRWVRMLVTDPARCAALGAAARRRALEQFSFDRMRCGYVTALEALFAEPAWRG